MKTKAIALICLALLSSCSKMEGCIELPQNYRLWMVSSKEKYITTEDDSYYLGPMIYSIGVQNEVIFGENAKIESGRLKNVAGYFVLAGSKGVYTGLSKSEYERIAKDVGIAEFVLKDGPSDLSKSGRYSECR